MVRPCGENIRASVALYGRAIEERTGHGLLPPFHKRRKVQAGTPYRLDEWFLSRFDVAGIRVDRDEALAKEARKYTNRLQDMQYYTGNHDLGFMMFCSYGQGIRLKPEPTDSLILVHSSESLCSRYSPKVGLIRSWDFGDWSYPVIIVI